MKDGGKMERDIIRKTFYPVVCEECGSEIKVGHLINEYRQKGSKESMYYCMECLPKLTVGVGWTRRRKR
jgi:hypothetical protein